nr:hypothetical protein [Planotetraspora kaengkrachanensis]
MASKGPVLVGGVLAVPENDLDLRVAGVSQEASRPLGDPGIDVDGQHKSIWTDDFGDERGVVSARTDLQDPCSTGQLGGLEHLGLQPGSADGTGRLAVRVAFGDDHVPG